MTGDRFGRLRMNDFAIKQRGSPQRLEQARDSAQQRGFAAAVRPYQHRHFLLRDGQRDIINDDFF